MKLVVKKENFKITDFLIKIVKRVIKILTKILKMKMNLMKIIILVKITRLKVKIIANFNNNIVILIKKNWNKIIKNKEIKVDRLRPY